MHYEGKPKLSSHNTSYCLIEVVAKAGLTVSRVEKFHNSLVAEAESVSPMI